MNEVFCGQKDLEELTRDLKLSDAKALGAELTAEAHRLDSSLPVIENSGIPTICCPSSANRSIRRCRNSTR